MNKEEFILNIDSVLTSLKEEYPSNQEEIISEINKLKDKINESLIKRINSSTLNLLKQYKNERIVHIQYQKYKLDLENNSLKNRLEYLYNTREQLLNRNLSLDDKRINKMRAINNEITFIKLFDLKKNTKEINELEIKEKEIANSSIENVKNNIFENFDNKDFANYVNYLLNNKKVIKNDKLLKLLDYYQKLLDSEKQIKGKIYISTKHLPVLVEMIKNSNCYDFKTFEINDIDKLNEIFANYEQLFYFQKNNFITNFTEEKLSNLKDENKDNEYIELHKNKIDYNKLNIISKLNKYLQVLTKNKIITNELELEINEVNNNINKEYKDIYNQIKMYYLAFDYKILDISSINDLDNIEYSNIENMLKEIDLSEKNIIDIKEKINKVTNDIKNIKDKFNEKKNETLKEIKTSLLENEKEEEEEIEFLDEPCIEKKIR